MSKLIVHNEKIVNREEWLSVCPFGAIELSGEAISINSACKLCKICVKKSTQGEFEFFEEKKESINKDDWQGVCVYVDHEAGEIHPVTYELLGKARELADKVKQEVYALFVGDGISDKAGMLCKYGADEVFVYDNPGFRDFRIEPYTAAFADFINEKKPSVILVGGTSIGRQLAPRVAARFRTGLTADCTILDIKENTDLIQIRPAFGGNIMAQIITPNNRPQMATVRYKVMNTPECDDSRTCRVTLSKVTPEMLVSNITVLSVQPKEKVKTIDNADIIVAAGRGIKNKNDLRLVRELADALGGEFACTRPLVECGWVEARRQIGLSGRTVRPKLMITCGISGAIQFTAGMKSSEMIFAINSDPQAPIFKTAHYGIVGDLYEIIPRLIERITNK
jgi:electron transfer flavoprotein alpha subunit